MRRHAKNNIGDTFYHPSTCRKRTFVRQLVVDTTIFAQNIVMIVLAKDTITTTVKFHHSYTIIVIVTGICYTLSMLLKLLFYTQCHPWAKIIKSRPRSPFETTTVVCSKHFDVKFEKFSLKFVKATLAPKHSGGQNSQAICKNPKEFFCFFLLRCH